MTTTIPAKRYPQDVHLGAADPLPKAGRIMANQLMTISKARLKQYKADLRPQQVKDLSLALCAALGLLPLK